MTTSWSSTPSTRRTSSTTSLRVPLRPVVADDARDEVEYMISAACAGEDVPEDAFPDRWAALSNEITPKAKAKGRGKATKATKEPKEKAPPT